MDAVQKSAILLVEDDESDVLRLRRAFQKARIASLLIDVRDGEQAIQYLSGVGIYANRSKYPIPSLVLLDLRLPKLSGFEVLEWIREQADLCKLIIVVLTGSDAVPDANKAYKLGANSYLIKPGNTEELVEMLTRLEDQWLTAEQLPIQPRETRLLA
jgi:DNA-binding response OmpR family regulator